MTTNPSPVRRFLRPAAVAAVAVAACAAPASAAAPEGWRRWWLPENFSKHGGDIDLLFNVIFAICAVAMVGVFFFIIRYCIKYRYRAGAKAHFSHGNKKLELIWTAIPAVIFLAIALWTKASWDDFRQNDSHNDPARAQILVIAEQFNWNVVYPGPDGKIGRYLAYPKTTDAKWPAMPPGEDSPFEAEYKVPGPAFLPPDKARKALNDYIATVNPLGKDFEDPDGKDDNFEKFPGRQIFVPKGRPIDIHLSSKDVLHDFFLPDFRVKLDAVPGMRGHIYFTATKSSAEMEAASAKPYTLEEAEAAIGDKLQPKELKIVVPPAEAADYTYEGEEEKSKKVGGKTVKVKTKVDVQIADGDRITPELLAGLRQKGKLKSVNAKTVQVWEVVCEELCGVGHTIMRGSLVVLEPDEYAKRFETKPVAAAEVPASPATPHAAAVSAAR